jgi:hypothetical protein
MLTLLPNPRHLLPVYRGTLNGVDYLIEWNQRSTFYVFAGGAPVSAFTAYDVEESEAHQLASEWLAAHYLGGE